MSLSRKIVIGLLTLTGFFVLLVVLLLLPVVQTAIANRAISSLPDTKASLGKVAIGMTSVEVKNLEFSQPGIHLRLPSLELAMDMKGLVSEKVSVSKLQIQGWKLEVDPDALPESPQTKTETFSVKPLNPEEQVSGILSRLKLPVDLIVGMANVEGDFSLKGAQPLNGHLVLDVSGIEAGKTGTMNLKIIANPEKLEGIDSVELNTSAQVIMKNSREFSGINGTTWVSGSGEKFPKLGNLKLDTHVSEGPGAEEIQVSLDQGERNLLSLKSVPLAERSNWQVDWSVDLKDTDLQAYSLGFPIPSFALNGEGRSTLDLDKSALTFSGKVTANVADLSVFSTDLKNSGQLDLSLEFAGGQTDGAISMDHLVCSLSLGQSETVTANLIQPVSWNHGKGVGARSPGDFAQVSVHVSNPDRWQHLLGKTTLHSGPLDSACIASVDGNGGYSLRFDHPLTLSNLNLDQSGTAVLSGVNLNWQGMHAQAHGKNWSLDLGHLSLDTNQGKLLTLEGQASGQDNDSLSGHLTITSDAVSAAAQPCGEIANVAAGQLKATINVTHADKWDMTGAILLSGFKTSDKAGLPDLSLHLKGESNGADIHSFQSELSVASATTEKQNSDFKTQIELKKEAGVLHVTGKLTGGYVNVPDLQAWGGIVKSSTDDSKVNADPESEKIAASSPPWAGINGRLDLALESVVLLPGLEIAPLTGWIEVGPDGLKIHDVSSGVLEGKVDASGTLLEQANKDYEWQLNLEGNDLKPGPFLKSLSPGKPVPIEGTVSLKSSFSGKAASLDNLTEKPTGNVMLTVEQGTLRALGVKVDSLVQKGNTVAGLVGLFGAVTGDAQTTQYAARLKALTEVASRLSNLNFQNMALGLNLLEGSGVDIRQISLESDGLRLNGSGKLEGVGNKHWWDWPLVVSLNLSSRGELADKFKLLKLVPDVDTSTDFVSLIEPIKLDGSLSAIGTEQLNQLLSRAIKGNL